MTPMALGVALAPCLMRPPGAAGTSEGGGGGGVMGDCRYHYYGVEQGADSRLMHAVQRQADFMGRMIQMSLGQDMSSST